jgi:hypothetical protein
MPEKMKREVLDRISGISAPMVGWGDDTAGNKMPTTSRFEIILSNLRD